MYTVGKWWIIIYTSRENGVNVIGGKIKQGEIHLNDNLIV